MNRLVKAQISLESARKDLGALLDIEERAEDFNVKLETAKAKVVSAQAEFSAAALVEPDDHEKRSEGTPENRELSQLRQRASLVDFVKESEGIPVGGASLEYRSAMLGTDMAGFVPLELFGFEERADAVTNIGTAIQENQMAIQPRVFNMPAAEYLGCVFPVRPGWDQLLAAFQRRHSGRRSESRRGPWTA